MTVWNIAQKDLSLLLRDRRTMVMLLALPLLFIMIIGMTTGQLLGWKSSNQVLKIAIIDHTDYEGIGSREFLESGDASDTEPMNRSEREREQRIASHLVVDIFNGIQQTPGLEIRTVGDWRNAGGTLSSTGATDLESLGEDMLEEGDVNALLIFRPEFYEKVYFLGPERPTAEGEAPDGAARLMRMGIDVRTRNPNSATASAVLAVVGLNVMDVLNPLVVCRSLNATVTERASARYRNYCGPIDAMGRTEPDELLGPIADKETGARGSVYDELVPSYTVMFVFFLVNIMARSFLTERELGTMRRLRIAPVSPWSVLLGKTIPFFIISLLQTFVLFGAGKLLFDMSWGTHPMMLLPVIVATSAAATGLGLLIATMVSSDSQVSAYATTVMIVMAGISGCFMPRPWLPELMQQISLVTPHAWALMGYQELLDTSRVNLQEVWKNVAMLTVFAGVYLIAGAWRYRYMD